MLGAIINEEEDSGEHAITEYLLYNIHNKSDITINEIVDEAFVSRSSVRRYCNKLGYKNFSELKNSLTDIIFPSNLHLRNFEPVQEYRSNIMNELSHTIIEMNHMINDEVIDRLVNLFYMYKNITLISPNNTSSNLLKFQQELFYAKKIIRVVNNNFDSDYINNVSAQSSLILTISVSGFFAKEVNENMSKVNGKKILITGNRSQEFIDLYDEVIYLSRDNIESDNLGLFGKYGITYLFDLISEHYIYKYKR
ncbi:MurR/RpiR family transcriptional regulator [Paraliobacillus sp. JSM ZJ581]|uniref:MurR/RpiR family transcriptional regulator n=1 Tax=Paraliobacillus sp. JSM ZJ581 TaxID=3342118 RepID=UPI0035A9533D